MFGELSYSSFNLGDNIQSLAARRVLQDVGVVLPDDSIPHVDRDASRLPSQPLRLISNGWFDGRFTKFPYPESIDPLFLSFHVNDEVLPAYYSDVMPVVSTSTDKLVVKHTEYLKQFAPIGCRDHHTMKWMKQCNIPHYFSGCLTLLLYEPDRETNPSEILMVDVEENLLEMIPLDIRQKAIQVTHHLPRYGMPHSEKMQRAKNMVKRFASASCVITSRLHAALPCVANGVPVVFLTQNPLDVRFQGLIDLIPCVLSPGDPWAIRSYTSSIHTKLHSLQKQMRQRVSDWVYRPFLSRLPSANASSLSDHLSVASPLSIASSLSVVVACMNRESHLIQSLPTWIALQPMEIILIAWGPPLSHPKLLKLIHTHASLIRVVHVRNVNQWWLTSAYNLAFQMAYGNRILKVDCDTLLRPDFCDVHPLSSSVFCNSVFYTGNWKTAPNANKVHLNGVFYAHRADILAVGGFSEFLQCYGWDDSDLYERMSRHLRRKDFDWNTLDHIPHGNRIIDGHDDEKRAQESITHNWDIAHKRIWTSECPFSRFLFVQFSRGFALCDLLFAVVPLFIPPLSPSLPPLLPPSSSSSSPSSILVSPSSNTPILDVTVICGIGNRLRTLASCYHIALGLQRPLVVRWMLDLHCQARFEDLFEIPTNMILKEEPASELGITIEEGSQNLFDDPTLYKNKDIYIVTARVIPSKWTSWDKECQFLRNLRRKPVIQDKVNEFLHLYDFPNRIGVHIRMGQDPKLYAFDDVSHYSEESKNSTNKWRKESHWNIFLKEMLRILEKQRSQKFFLCADNQEAIDAIVMALPPDSVLTIPRCLFDRSKEQVIGAMIEVDLLSKTCELLGSWYSTFSELVIRLGVKKARMAGKDF